MIKNKLALWSLILPLIMPFILIVISLFSFSLGFIGLSILLILAPLSAIISIILGIIVLKRGEKNILAIIGIILSTLIIIYLLYLLLGLFSYEGNLVPS